MKNENVKNKIGLIIIRSLLVLIVINVFYLIYYVIHEKNEKMYESNIENAIKNNTINSKIKYNLKDVNYPLEESVLIEGLTSYEDNRYKIYINNKKQVEVIPKSVKTNKFVISNLQNVKQILVDTHLLSYSFLTEDGSVYLLESRAIDFYLDPLSKDYDLDLLKKGVSPLEADKLLNPDINKEINDTVKFNKIYMVKNYFGNDISLEYNYKFIGESEDKKYYSISNWAMSNSTISIHPVVYSILKNINSVEDLENNNLNLTILKYSQSSGISMDKNGHLKIFQKGEYLNNKFLLPDGSEAIADKIFLEKINDNETDLYVITKDKKLYSMYCPYFVTISSELKLTEINNGKIIKSISYEIDKQNNNNYFYNDDYVISNLKFNFEDDTNFIVDTTSNNDTYRILRGE